MKDERELYSVINKAVDESFRTIENQLNQIKGEIKQELYISLVKELLPDSLGAKLANFKFDDSLSGDE